jgi:hypothetical protein
MHIVARMSLKAYSGQSLGKQLNRLFLASFPHCVQKGQCRIRATAADGDVTSSRNASKMGRENFGHRPPEIAPLAPLSLLILKSTIPPFNLFPLSRSKARWWSFFNCFDHEHGGGRCRCAFSIYPELCCNESSFGVCKKLLTMDVVD